jgi:hypothetical protein
MLASGQPLIVADSTGGFMRFLFCLLMAAATGAASDGQPVVEVFMPPVPGMEMALAFLRAQGVVNEIYSGIGVRVVWGPVRSRPLGCMEKPLYRKIVVALREQAPAGLPQEAQAFSNPYSTEGPCITLLMDRFRPDLQRSPMRTGSLLGHVLAHEMGHVLQGIARHSETGVMKGHWSEKEVVGMPMERLRFTPYDAQLILDGISGRVKLSDVTVTAGGQTVPVSFAGAQDVFYGLDQVNVLLPHSLAGIGQVEIELSIDGWDANRVTVSIR